MPEWLSAKDTLLGHRLTPWTLCGRERGQAHARVGIWDFPSGPSIASLLCASCQRQPHWGPALGAAPFPLRFPDGRRPDGLPLAPPRDGPRALGRLLPGLAPAVRDADGALVDSAVSGAREVLAPGWGGARRALFAPSAFVTRGKGCYAPQPGHGCPLHLRSPRMDHVTKARSQGTAPLTPAAPLFPDIAHAKQRALLAAVAHCCSVTQACAQVGLSRQTHYEWLHENPTYAAAFAHAKQMGAEWLEDRAIERATTGEKPSDVLLIFLLKGAMPDKYRDQSRREDRNDISELLKAVLLELSERSQAREVTPEAEWSPLPPGERPKGSQRAPLPAPPEW